MTIEAFWIQVSESSLRAGAIWLPACLPADIGEMFPIDINRSLDRCRRGAP